LQQCLSRSASRSHSSSEGVCFPRSRRRPLVRDQRRYPAKPRADSPCRAGTAHVRSLASCSSVLAREGIWCRVGTRWYPEVPARYPAPFGKAETPSSATASSTGSSTGSRRSGDRRGSRGITCGDGGIGRTLRAKAVRSTPPRGPRSRKTHPPITGRRRSNHHDSRIRRTNLLTVIGGG
jgi:hypothetical protein